MSNFTNLLALAAIVCYIVDVSGFIDTLKEAIFRLINSGVDVQYRDYSLKPFDCSLCAVWWATLTYTVISNGWTTSIIDVLICALLSIYAGVISDTLMLTRDVLIKFIDKIYTLIK